jgi:hypothetical protein
MAMLEKATYLKGLFDGVELDVTTKEGKIIAALVNLVENMADKIDSLQAQIDEVHDYCEELDEDLGDVEEVLLDLDEDDDDDNFCCCDEFDDDCDGNCCDCDFDCGFDDDLDDDEDGEFFEIVCPACGDVINFDATLDPENLRCPNCGEKFECIVDEDDLKAIDGMDKD